MAALVASGGVGPALLKADALSRLYTTANPNPVQRLSQPANIGDNTIFLDDATPFPGGSFIYLTSNPSAGGLTTNGPYQVLSSSAKGITIVGTLSGAWVVGDLVVGIPALMLVGEAPIDRPVTSAQLSTPVLGAAPSIVFPATPNMSWKLAYLNCTLRTSAAVTDAISLSVWDGVSGGIGRYFADLSVDGTIGRVDRVKHDRLPIASSRGNALTIDSTVPGQGTSLVRLSAGAWQTPQLR